MIANNGSRILIPIAKNLMQKRFESVVSGPPTVHIPKLEKYLLAGGMISAMLFTPVWVLLHLREYRGLEPKK